MKLKNNSLIAGGFAHPKNSQSVNLRLASNLLKTFQTPNSGSAKKVTSNNYNPLKTLRCSKLSNAQKVISNNQNANMQVAQILSVTGSYSQKKDGVTTVLIWTQQGIKKNGYEINYIRLAHSLQSSAGGWNLMCVRLTYEVQPFGSMPNRFNSLRQAALTHALNGLLPITDSICSSKSSSKRIIFIVLLVRLNGFFSFFTCIGKYHYVNLSLIGKYHNTRYTYKKATPRSDANTIEASNHNVKRSNIMAIYKSTQTHPKFIQHQSGKFFPHHSAKSFAQQSAKYFSDYKPVKNNLPLLVEFSYIDFAPYKTGVRRGNLNILKATHDAESVFFCVQTKHINAPYSMVWCIPLKAVNLLSIGWNTLHRPSMVALMGQPSGWLVSFSTSISTPVNVTTPNERGNSGGDSLHKLKEIIPMMTIPNSAYPKFLWRFFSCQQSKYFTVEAISEQEARSMLPDAPCLFSARIRQGVNYA